MSRLKTHPLVSKITHKHHNGDGIFQVKFTDGITESWGYTETVKRLFHHSFIIPAGRPLFNEKKVVTYREFETNPLKSDYEELLPYFLISNKELHQSGFCEARLKVHELIKELTTEGWVDPHYPDFVLKRDFDNIKTSKLSNYWEASHRMTMYKWKGLPPGRILLTHFNKIGNLKHKNRPSLIESWIASSLFPIINRLISTGYDITRASIIRCLTADINNSTYIAGPRLPSIVIWRAIFEKFKIKSVVDLDPNFGEKLIAAAACGAHYQPIEWTNVLQDINNFIKPVSTVVDPIMIINCTTPLSDEELLERLKKVNTDSFIIIISKEQLPLIKYTELYEIRTEPSFTTKTLNYIVRGKRV